MASPIDYDLAVRTAARLAPAGPRLDWTEAADVVAQLRALTVEAEEHVRAVTGLIGQPGPATVVDRPGWASANVDGFKIVLAPLAAKMTQGAVAGAVTSRLTGLQMGTVLSWLSSKVLGQYEAFQPAGQAGRLILVAPNIVETERRLGVDPHDFRLWVALHEVTHRTQFTAVPWLHDHVRDEVQALLSAASLDDPAALAERLRGLVTHRPRGGSLLELLQTPEQKLVMDRVTAFMSLLEGHAEHVMDGVGPAVVPSVQQIRDRFDAKRRDRGGPIDRLLRKLLGLDLKARQYAEGSRFVRAAVDAVGMPGFNRVWESPATLPTLTEIREPLAWVRRVHSGNATVSGTA